MKVISFIIPVKNRSGLFEQAISSLLTQSDSAWEAIVVDDRSDNHEFEKIQQICMADSRIKLKRRDGTRGGAPVCRNLGVRYATSDYMVFLDSDDMIGKDFVKTRLETMAKEPGCQMWIFPVRVFMDIPGDSRLLWNVFNEHNDLDRFLNADPPWHTASPVWEKKSFLDTGGFDEELLCWQDWEIHVKALVLNLKYIKIDQKPDIFYRLHDRDAIRKHNISKESLLSRFAAVKSTFLLMKNNSTLNKRRKYLFGKLIINIYISLYKTDSREADILLDFIAREKILSGFEMKIWLVRIKNSNIEILNKVIDKMIYRKHNDHFLDTKTDYLHTETVD
ncbi:MAG TPA: glycosyltransferase family 2 protein [Bacteroidales bacterium]|nr:glycosyltransferase family 2 protein [Bacteroidales bacterium]